MSMVKLTVEHEMTEAEVRYEANRSDIYATSQFARERKEAARRWVAEHPEQRSPREVVEALIIALSDAAFGDDQVVAKGVELGDLRRVLAELPPDGHVAVHLPVDAEFWALDETLAWCRAALDRHTEDGDR